jgi:hypothetical protein
MVKPKDLKKIFALNYPNPPRRKLRLHPFNRTLNIDCPASIPHHHRLKPSRPSIDR